MNDVMTDNTCRRVYGIAENRKRQEVSFVEGCRYPPFPWKEFCLFHKNGVTFAAIYGIL
ncbi:MAG: hypothetical protein SOR61_06810 [Evtepia sp.]|uniref:hypothetical protein n=1 Tax=Evtepia sp. TaxID=2773933 RepID=UPI002A765D73|nr:hypothetical protein [Evtepia sp.]MDY3014879.1 hypothetical protein [Evtepia sp.]